MSGNRDIKIQLDLVHTWWLQTNSNVRWSWLGKEMICIIVRVDVNGNELDSVGWFFALISVVHRNTFRFRQILQQVHKKSSKYVVVRDLIAWNQSHGELKYVGNIELGIGEMTK